MVGKNKHRFVYGGKEYTRNSDRKYLYAVVGSHAHGVEISYATTKERAVARANSFKSLRETIKDPITKRYRNIGKPIYTNVKIVPL